MSKILTENQKLIQEFKQICEKFSEDTGKDPIFITRNDYRRYLKGSSKFEKVFESFTAFKEATLGKTSQHSASLDLEKKIISLQDELTTLKKDKETLLKSSLETEKLLELYQENMNKNFTYPYCTELLADEDEDKELVLNLCDIHLGEVVDPKDVNFVNEFNKEICIQRLNTLFQKTISYSQRIHSHKIHILMNGDLISGGIHMELARNSDLNEVESIFYLQEYLVNKFCELTAYFDVIDVDVVVGNHARILPGKPYFKEQTSMSYEYLLGRQLKMYFDLINQKENSNKIRINVSESPFIVKKIKNTKFLVTHGHILTGSGSGGFAGIPFYSIAMSSARLFGILHQLGITDDVQFDHIIVGHLHTSTKVPLFNGGYCFVGGCVIGTNEFSLFKMKSVAKKEQLLLVVDNDGIDGEINIRL